MSKRIAFITHESPLITLGGEDAGGQVVYVDKLSKALISFGYEVDIYVRWENERLPQIVHSQKGIRIIHIQAGPVTPIPKEHILPYMQEFAEQMQAFIAKERIDYTLIHAHYFMSGIVAGILKERLGIPFIITFHALGKVRRNFLGKSDKFGDERFALEEQLVAQADRIIAECPQDREDLIYLYHGNQDKIAVIPCGFDPLEFYPMDKRLAKMHIGVDPEQPVLLELGRMVPRKGIDTGIKALQILQNEYAVHAKLLIVGGASESADPTLTPEIGRLQAVAKAHNVLDDVVFVGSRKREELKYYYNASDVFIDTPWYEPFGLTPLESMACGTPVVGSSVGGIQFTVQNGKTGFLVPAQDPAKLAEKTAEILRNPTLAEKFKENSLKRVHAFFTWSTIATSMNALYEKVMFSQQSDLALYQHHSDLISSNFNSLIAVLRDSQERLRFPLIAAAKLLIRTLQGGNKILICEDGGSASDAQHFAGELAGHMGMDRPALAALALNSDTSVLTAIANDYSYDSIFSRQVEAYGKPGDVLIGISTSGNSENVIQAMRVAREKQMFCIGLLGKNGGKLFSLCDIPLVVPTHSVQHIQEVHTHLIHTLCELIEKQLFVDIPQTTHAPIGMKQGKSLVRVKKPADKGGHEDE